MKKIIVLLFLLLILSSCNNKEALKNINGTWLGDYELKLIFNEDDTFSLTCLNYKCDKKLVKTYIYEDDRRLEPCEVKGRYELVNGKYIYLYQDENTCNRANEDLAVYSFNNDYQLICQDDTSRCSIGLEKEGEAND